MPFSGIGLRKTIAKVGVDPKVIRGRNAQVAMIATLRGIAFRFYWASMLNHRLMETIYIQFEEPPIGTKIGGGKRSIKKVITRLIAMVIPIANPTFDDKIDDVKSWLVECDRRTGIAQREIGLNSKGAVIMKMPYGRNCGYWTDNSLLLDDFKQYFYVSEITMEYFDQHWEKI